MAGFARFVAAAVPTLGLDPEDFLRAYAVNTTVTQNVNQTVQGLQMIGQVDMNQQQVKQIVDTVSMAEATRLSLLATMNPELGGGGSPRDGGLDVEGEDAS